MEPIYLCPECDTPLSYDMTRLLMSNPPQYIVNCSRCGYSTFSGSLPNNHSESPPVNEIKTYTEKEVSKLLGTQRGNCYVAIQMETGDEDLASVAMRAPEPYNWKK